jgi:hypothetical protein
MVVIFNPRGNRHCNKPKSMSTSGYRLSVLEFPFGRSADVREWQLWSIDFGTADSSGVCNETYAAG